MLRELDRFEIDCVSGGVKLPKPPVVNLNVLPPVDPDNDGNNDLHVSTPASLENQLLNPGASGYGSVNVISVDG